MSGRVPRLGGQLGAADPRLPGWAAGAGAARAADGLGCVLARFLTTAYFIVWV